MRKYVQRNDDLRHETGMCDSCLHADHATCMRPRGRTYVNGSQCSCVCQEADYKVWLETLSAKADRRMVEIDARITHMNLSDQQRREHKIRKWYRAECTCNAEKSGAQR